MSDLDYAERKLTLDDGTVLHLEQHKPLGQPRAVLVMVHGFAVHCGRYREVAAHFARLGFAVTAFDCRGHGRSTGSRGFVRRFPDFLADLGAVIQVARRPHDRLPVVVVGHSHGGTISLRYAFAHPTDLSALVLVAPWLGLKMAVPRWKVAMSRVAGGIWPRLTMGNHLRTEDSTREHDVRARWADDPLAHHVATPRWFNEVRDAQAYILAHAATLPVPTLMAVAGHDRVVSTDTSLEFARNAGALLEVKVYEEAFHELFLERDWRSIVEELVSWVVARLSAPYTSVIG